MDCPDATADVEESGVGGQGRLDGVEQQACRSHRSATAIPTQLALSEATVEFTFDTLALAAGHRSCVVSESLHVTAAGGIGHSEFDRTGGFGFALEVGNGHRTTDNSLGVTRRNSDHNEHPTVKRRA